MFIALDELKNKIPIESVESEKKYYCPKCGELLTVKNKGKKVAAHFAHKPESNCDDWGDMSEWHREWQNHFPLEYQEVVMEKDGEKHRADICIEGRKLVIEFQHSPIDAEEFNRRNLFYTGCGYRLIWVFDAAKKLNFPARLPTELLQQGKTFLRRLEWKRAQETFRGFPEFLEKNGANQIQIYLEFQKDEKTTELIQIKGLDEKKIAAYYTCLPIHRDNFLKEYDGIGDPAVSSIEQIFFDTWAKLDPQGWKAEQENNRIHSAGNPGKRPVKRSRRF